MEGMNKDMQNRGCKKGKEAIREKTEIRKQRERERNTD
jgi:hypothetical protein